MCTYVCICICMYICICMCIYIYIYIGPPCRRIHWASSQRGRARGSASAAASGRSRRGPSLNKIIHLVINDNK